MKMETLDYHAGYILSASNPRIRYPYYRNPKGADLPFYANTKGRKIYNGIDPYGLMKIPLLERREPLLKKFLKQFDAFLDQLVKLDDFVGKKSDEIRYPNEPEFTKGSHNKCRFENVGVEQTDDGSVDKVQVESFEKSGCELDASLDGEKNCRKKETVKDACEAKNTKQGAAASSLVESGDSEAALKNEGGGKKVSASVEKSPAKKSSNKKKTPTKAKTSIGTKSSSLNNQANKANGIEKKPEKAKSRVNDRKTARKTENQAKSPKK